MSDWGNYIMEYEQEAATVDFIQIDFLLDVREAQSRYQEQYKNDVNKIRSLKMSFDDWLETKKFEAAKLYIKHNKLNTERR